MNIKTFRAFYLKIILIKSKLGLKMFEKYQDIVFIYIFSECAKVVSKIHQFIQLFLRSFSNLGLTPLSTLIQIGMKYIMLFFSFEKIRDFIPILFWFYASDGTCTTRVHWQRSRPLMNRKKYFWWLFLNVKNWSIKFNFY